MPVKIEVAGHLARVKIEVLGYENLAPQTTSDANWLRCNVDVQVGNFSGQVNAVFSTHDFAAFAASLRRAVGDLSGQAAFETDEDALRLNIETARTGTARVSGILREVGRPLVAFSFSFDSDQTFLSRTVDALGEMGKLFPVRD